MTEPIYCGNGKVITTKYGEMIKLSITAENLATMQENLKNGWVNVIVGKRKNPSEKGTTHYLAIDNWEPKK